MIPIYPELYPVLVHFLGVHKAPYTGERKEELEGSYCVGKCDACSTKRNERSGNKQKQMV
jgi:hypothetical protein